MLKSIGKLATESKKIQEQIRKLAQDQVKPSIKEAIDELRVIVPTLQRIRWRQYTPYFNDGDECTFSLHGVYFEFENNPDDDSGDYDDNFVSPYSAKISNLLTEVQAEALEEFESELGDLDALLKDAFGDHTMVTVSVDGIETEEYSHD